MSLSLARSTAFGTYPWHAPTIDMPGLVNYMSKKLKLHHDIVRDAVAYEVFRVIGESNAFMKVYPPILNTHRFNAGVVDREWLNDTGLHDIFSDFIEGLRDDIDLLRRRVPGTIGLYTDATHICRCCKTGVFNMPIIDETHIQDVRAWRGDADKTDWQLMVSGCVYSQGGALVLPELAGEHLLKPWQCGDDIYVHKLPTEMLVFLRCG